MKSLLLLCVVCQLTEVINIPLVAINSNTANSCSSNENLEGAIQSLRISARAMVSGLLAECGEEPWHQLVAINMSSAESQCPDGWVEENQGGVRACGRGSVGPSCESTFLNTEHQMRYSRVCGRALGYQYGHTDAFFANLNGVVSIDQPYVDGLSITYGSPRQHIWTFAAGHEIPAAAEHNCPCTAYPGVSPPPYVGNNWYCESGTPSHTMLVVYPDDPLWDGKDCSGNGTCCSIERNGKSPPWFSVELPAPTNDYIEARICANEFSDSQEDTFINIFEIYVQ